MIAVPIEKVQDELNFLKQLLKGLGFSFINEVKDIKVAVNRASRYFLTGVFKVCINGDDVVGECILLVPSSRPSRVSITLNQFTIPEDVVAQLLLLGFKVESNNWLEYEVAIE